MLRPAFVMRELYFKQLPVKLLPRPRIDTDVLAPVPVVLRPEECVWHELRVRNLNLVRTLGH